MPGKYRFISAGYTHSCAISFGGQAYCWGDGRTGALGLGTLDIRKHPARVSGDSQFVELGAGDGYTCAATKGGALFCWGKAPPVPGYPAVQATPRRVGIADSVGRISTGEHHACALGKDGRAYCWGRNIEGQNGIGSRGVNASLSPQPTPVAGPLRFRSISAGQEFTCAVTTDGVPYCWGSNATGVLGDSVGERCGDVNPVPCFPRPVRIATDVRFVDIATGEGHACARTRQGAVYCWGSNSHGQVGAPRSAGAKAVSTPHQVAIGDVTGFSVLAAGGIHTCALSLTGALYCWGGETLEPPGVGANSDARLAPARRLPNHTFVFLAAGQAHTCGLSPSGAAFCWGDNRSGALGVP